jgi:hypothetical protein
MPSAPRSDHRAVRSTRGDGRARPGPRLPAWHRPRPPGRDRRPDLVGALGLTSPLRYLRGCDRRRVQGLRVDRPVALSVDQPGRYAGRPRRRGDARRAVCRRVQLDGAALGRWRATRMPAPISRRLPRPPKPRRSSTLRPQPPTSTSVARSTTASISSGGWPRRSAKEFGVPDFNLDSDRGYAWHCWDWDRSAAVCVPDITPGLRRGLRGYPPSRAPRRSCSTPTTTARRIRASGTTGVRRPRGPLPAR